MAKNGQNKKQQNQKPGQFKPLVIPKQTKLEPNKLPNLIKMK